MWILFAIVFSFGQFIVTNIYMKRTVYDPIGKYYGSLLFGGIGLTGYWLKEWGRFMKSVSIGGNVKEGAYCKGKAKNISPSFGRNLDPEKYYIGEHGEIRKARKGGKIK